MSRIETKDGRTKTTEALELATTDGILEDADLDPDKNPDFFTETTTQDGWVDGFKLAVTNFLEDIRQGKRKICVTEKGLALLSGLEGVSLKEGAKPADYCRPPSASTSPAPVPAPPPAPSPSEPPSLGPVAPAPEAREPLPIPAPPPLPDSFGVPEARTEPPPPPVAPAPPAPPPPEALAAPITDPAALLEANKKKAAPFVERATRAANAAGTAKVETEKTGIAAEIDKAKKGAEKAAQAKKEADQAAAAGDVERTKAAAAKAEEGQREAEAALQAARAAKTAADTAATSTHDLSGAVPYNELSDTVRSRKVKITLSTYKKGDYLKKIEAQFYIPETDPAKVFEFLKNSLRGKTRFNNSWERDSHVTDWRDDGISGTCIHNVLINSSGVKFASSARYTMRDNEDGTYGLTWTTVTPIRIKMAQYPEHTPLTQNIGAWTIKAVVEMKNGKPVIVGTLVELWAWTHPAEKLEAAKKVLGDAVVKEAPGMAANISKGTGGEWTSYEYENPSVE
ncbi:MAG: hypothetical protein HYT76_07480 [Deltaproteobacteria bacterium]|nr:hypothetical protein [Deltaproteobacteria bacterium]